MWQLRPGFFSNIAIMADAFGPASLFSSDTGGYWDVTFSTLWQDSARTTPATADDHPVGAIDDLSGNDNHLLQATAGFRPLLKISGGVRWLEFDGVDNFLREMFTCDQPLDRVMAFRQITWDANETLWDGGAQNQCRVYTSNNGDPSPNMRVFAGSSQIDLSNEALDTDQVHTERWDGANSRWTFDNNSYTTGNAGAAASAGLCVGCFGSTSEGFANIRWYGGLQIGRSLTDPEIAACRTFFAALQGRTL